VRPFREDRIRKAARDLRFLLDRGYPRESALKFVGDRLQLRREERDLLFRGVFPRKQIEARRAKAVRLRDLRGQNVVMDGHNVLITLESALAGKPLVLADDGFVRDISRIFRGFRPTGRTRAAWQLVQSLLVLYAPAGVSVILDAPLARSGELAGRIRRWMEESGILGDAVAEARPESAILKRPGITMSADSAIIDRAERVFDVAGHIVRQRMRLAPTRIP